MNRFQGLRSSTLRLEVSTANTGREPFRVPGGSMIDAVRRVRSIMDSVVSRGGMALAVSLNISCIRNAIEDYLRDRWIEYPSQYGRKCRVCSLGSHRNLCSSLCYRISGMTPSSVTSVSLMVSI